MAGRSPVDRGKGGLKRSQLCDAAGIPLATVPAAANRRDHQLLPATLDALKDVAPLPQVVTVHLDAGYDDAPCRAQLADRGLAWSISQRGTPVQVGKRWVVEAANSAMNDFGKLRRCTERSEQAVQAYLDLAAAIITVRALIRAAWTQYRWPTRPRSPRIRLGNEVSGIVDALGEGVDGLKVGDRVTGFVRGKGDAEYVLTTPDRLAVLPDALSLRSAAVIPQGVETARRSLALLKVEPGQTVVVNGAAGSVGSAAVQILLAQGVTVIGTASASNHDYLRTLGATPMEYGEKLLDQIAAAAPQGIDAALDCAGHGFVDQALNILAADQIITVADFAATAKGVQLAGGDPLALYADSFRSMLPLAAQGRFTTEVAAEFPLADLASAQSMSETGHLRGKILVRVTQLDGEDAAS